LGYAMKYRHAAPSNLRRTIDQRPKAAATRPGYSKRREPKMHPGKTGEKTLAAVVLLFLSFASAGAQVQVKTTFGTIEGTTEKGTTAFKGVPFAAPPVGERRWRAPQPPFAWGEVRKADKFSASCMQFEPGERLPWTKEFMVHNDISEDCLYLNIWTPHVDASANLPVIVYIHGGSFQRRVWFSRGLWRQQLGGQGGHCRNNQLPPRTFWLPCPS
jgi:hypothetical protein